MDLKKKDDAETALGAVNPTHAVSLDDAVWKKELAFEVALRYFTPAELLLKYSLTQEQYDAVTETEAFSRAALAAAREIDENGKQFRVLARKLATESLPSLYSIANDVDAPRSSRIAAIDALARYGGFDRQESEQHTAFQINVNLG